MRLHRLEVEGFGPFRDRQVVDFDVYADDGIFLITGRTGTGKSSILDAVCFALYGGVPRYESGDKRLRSDHCLPDDVSEVVVTFSAGERRLRVTRAPEYERPKRRGTGTAVEAHRASLDEWIGGEWVGIAARPVDVARELEQILQLTQQQFLQVILLAQGRFARFLLAKNDERQALLRTLFDTRRFEDYEKALEQRRKSAEIALGAGADQASLLLDEALRVAGAAGVDDGSEAPTRLAAAGIWVDRAAYQAETRGLALENAERDLRDAEAALTRLSADRERQRQRERSRERLAVLEARAPQIDADRRALAEAARAESVRAPIEAAQREAAAAEAADVAARAARAAWDELPDAGCGVAPVPGGALTAEDVGVLRRWADDLTEASGQWRAAVAAEAGLDDLVAEVAAATATVTALDERARAASDAAGRHPDALAALETGLEAARAAAALLAPAGSHLGALQAQRRAAVLAAALADEQRAAEGVARGAAQAHADAAAHVSALLQRRLAGFAGELAAGLVPGEPCAVCGGVEHPRPAERGPDAVDPADIAAAEQALGRAAQADAAATAALQAVRDRLSAAGAEAGGRSVAELDADIERAEAAHREAEQAEREARDLTAERAALIAAAERAQAEAAACAAERTAALAALATLEERLATARRMVDAARGPADSVAARVADARERIDRARALADASDARVTAGLRSAEASAALEASLRRHAFDGAAAAQAALRDESARTQLDERIRAHDAAIAAERAALLDLELAALPEEPIDLSPLEDAVALNRQARAAASAALARAQQTAETLRALVDRATEADADTARLRAEHDVVARLAHTVAGKAPNTRRMNLETFVLAAELEEIVQAANLRLADMSDGRYRLRHTDARAARGAASGLGVEIMDAYTGRSRPAQSLSGGETFLASLALALGLAEVVTARSGGIRLDTLFIDEGFGSLDPETLDVAMQTLDELRQGGRTIGLISHVETMKDQVPAQLRVEASAQGPSVIRQRSDARL